MMPRATYKEALLETAQAQARAAKEDRLYMVCSRFDGISKTDQIFHMSVDEFSRMPQSIQARTKRLFKCFPGGRIQQMFLDSEVL